MKRSVFWGVLVVSVLLVIFLGLLLYFVPVQKSPSLNSDKPVKIGVFYFHKGVAEELENDLCSTNALISLAREVPDDNLPSEALNELFNKPLSQEEIDAGFSSEFPHEGFRLEKLEIIDGVAKVTITQVPGFTTGGSCRIGIIRAQIEKTLLQFPEIKKVVILPEEAFQP